VLATIPILLGWLLTVGACYAAGVIVLRLFRPELYREEQEYFRFVIGAACFSLLIFLLTAAGLAYPPVFVGVEIAILLFAFWQLVRYSERATPLPDFAYIWKTVFWAPVTVFGVYYFIHALAPETSPDGATYHLGIVGRYLRQHSFGHITTQMYANLSEGIEMLFLAAYSVGKHSSAALVEFTFLLALPWGMLSYGRRIGFPKAGVLAALLVYASPIFGLSGTVAYNDVAGACVLFATFYLLQIWAETRQSRLIPLIGLLAGFCFAAKYTLFLALPFAGLFLLWKFWRAHQPFVRPLAMYAACALIMVIPWLAKNWIIVRNPLSPFANRLFPNPYITPQFEQEYSGMMRHREGLMLAQRPLDHIVLGGRTGGLLGPVFLLSPLALLALRFRAGRHLLLAGFLFTLPAYTNVETRFLMPMLPFLALALSLALVETPAGIPIVLAFHLLTAWPSSVQAYAAPFAWRLNDFHPAEAFRLVPETITLRTRMPDVRIAELLERETPANATIFAYGNPPEAYTSREIIVKYESALGNRLGEVLWAALLPDYQPKQELSFEFSPRTLQKFRVVQTATHPTSVWSVSELRVWDGGAEFVPDASWRFTSSVNPWDIGLAFDRHLVTQWSTVQAIRPGMYIEVDLGQERQVSRIVLDSAQQEWSGSLSLEVLRAGKWQALSTSPGSRLLSETFDLRREAISELKREGITHLLISANDIGKHDFFTKQTSWGIQFVDEAQGNRLYRLL